jgi:hypothetical protein
MKLHIIPVQNEESEEEREEPNIIVEQTTPSITLHYITTTPIQPPIASPDVKE